MKSYIQANVFEVQIVASQLTKDQIKGERFLVKNMFQTRPPC